MIHGLHLFNDDTRSEGRVSSLNKYTWLWYVTTIRLGCYCRKHTVYGCLISFERMQESSLLFHSVLNFWIMQNGSRCRKLFLGLNKCQLGCLIYLYYSGSHQLFHKCHPDSKVHGANMGPTWVLWAPVGPYVGPMNLAIRAVLLNVFL